MNNHSVSFPCTMTMDQSQSRLKLRISRMFRSSFGSCRSRNVSDVTAAPQPPETQIGHRNSFHFPMTDEPQLKSPKARNFPAICKPRCPESALPIVNHSCIRVSKEVLRRRKVCISGDGAGRKICSPFDDFYDFYGTTHKKKKKNRSKPRARRSGNSIKLEAFPFGSASNDSYSVRNSWWFSSDEDETDALFSSRSLSSDSSESLGRRKLGSSGRRTVKDSLAVVKRSSDPYSDFRTSMVEMIVEKQIFGTKDLEELLQCFLSLNSHEHHNMILEVFTEIWEALFCDWT